MRIGSLKESLFSWLIAIVRRQEKGFLDRQLIGLVRRIARLHFFLPLISGYAISQIKTLGPRAVDPQGLCLLVLNQERYSADLQVLANRPDVTLESLPSNTQHLINAIWVSKIREISSDDPNAYLMNESDEVKRVRADLHRFLMRLISVLSKKLKIDGIVTCTFYYRQDREWESAGHAVGVPFFVLHKENMKDPVTHRQTIDRYQRKHFLFRGDRLFLANEYERYVVLSARCADPERISVVGALRMDALYATLSPGIRSKKDKVVLFSTHHRLGLLEIPGVEGVFNPDYSDGFINHFRILHGSFAQLALENPDKNFVIKTKWAGNWFDEVTRAIRAVVGKEVSEIENLVLTDSVPAQELINSASAVVGLNSTTLLEAKLAHVPVILPIFEEAAGKYYETNIYFRDYLDIFSVADSPQSLKKLVSDVISGIALEQKPIPEDMVNKYLGYFDGCVADRVVDIMRQDISRVRGRSRLEGNGVFS